MSQPGLAWGVVGEGKRERVGAQGRHVDGGERQRGGKWRACRTSGLGLLEGEAVEHAIDHGHSCAQLHIHQTFPHSKSGGGGGFFQAAAAARTLSHGIADALKVEGLPLDEHAKAEDDVEGA